MYPPIIDRATYEKIQKTKHGRNTQKNMDKAQDIFKLTVPVRCPSCGDRMRRRHDSRCKCQERWTCENTACRLRIEISDAELLTALADLLGTVTADSIKMPAETPYEPSAEVIRLNNEISRMLDMAEIDKAVLRSKMTECFRQKYKELGNGCCAVQRLKAEVGSTADIAERLNRTVREIRLHTDKTADILLLNGQIIGKEKDDGTDRNDSAESGASDRAERINSENGWTLEGIYADKGISGTSVKNRDEFNRMIRRCKQGKIDMIITKSIARFARNTVDCLKYVRLLHELGVDVYFEEQGIHSNQPGAEFYITIYGSIAQSESENMSANIIWGKNQSAKSGKVNFHYKNFLGYRKGEDGQPEIVPEEAKTIRLIYDRFLAGDSLKGMAELLEERGIKSPTGKAEWQFSTIQSILSNERYKGDAIINKTYIADCISKKVRVNNGERPKYYVENSHPAIIDSATFGRVQEELARRSGKRKVKQKGTTTEQGKYSSKYALTELLICGECKTPYRRCTWTAGGKKKTVWRCISRLDFGKKYCHHSPTVEESILHTAVINAIMQTAKQNSEVLQTLKLQIGIGLEGEKSEDDRLDLQVRIAESDAQFRKMLDRVSADTVEAFDEETAMRLMNEKSRLQRQLDGIAETEQRRESAKSRLDDIFTILDGIKNRPMEYDDQIVRQLLECIVVDSKEQITVIFKGGLKVVQPLTD